MLKPIGPVLADVAAKAAPEYFRCPGCDFYHEANREAFPADCRPGGRRYEESELDANGQWFEVEPPCD